MRTREPSPLTSPGFVDGGLSPAPVSGAQWLSTDDFAASPALESSLQSHSFALHRFLVPEDPALV
jgi:hypothetical protein